MATHTPRTYLWDYNRNGLPWRANAYICQHGYDMSVCPIGDQYHRETGPLMVEHVNSTFAQQRDRIVVRNRLMGGEF